MARSLRVTGIAAFIGMLIGAAIAVSLSAGVGQAYAGGGAFAIGEISSGTVGLSYSSTWGDWWNEYSYVSTKKITNAKSSNKKVLVVSSSGKSLGLETKKPGKAKLTFKEGNKKRSVNIVVKKYANPFKKYKLGKRNYATSYNKVIDVYAKGAENKYRLTGVVSITPAKNWKIKAINAYVPFGTGMKKIPNNSKLPAGTTTVQVLMKNTKTKVTQRAYLYTAR